MTRQKTMLALLVIVVGLVGFGAPASADHQSWCQDFRVCLFENGMYGGSHLNIGATNGIYNLGDYSGPCSGTWNDCLSSTTNDMTSRDARLFTGADATGSSSCLDSDTTRSSMPPGFDDTVSSVIVYNNDNQCGP